MKNILTLLGRK